MIAGRGAPPDERLEPAISSMTLGLQYYMVQNDKIVVAGTCRMGASTFAVAGLLARVREGRAVEMLEE